MPGIVAKSTDRSSIISIALFFFQGDSAITTFHFIVSILKNMREAGNRIAYPISQCLIMRQISRKKLVTMTSNQHDLYLKPVFIGQIWTQLSRGLTSLLRFFYLSDMWIQLDDNLRKHEVMFFFLV